MPHRLQITPERLLDTIQEGIWVIDKNSNTTFVNPKMAEILGYSIKDMIGKSLFDFIDEEELRNVNNNVNRRKSGISETHDSRFKHKEGHDVYVELKTIPILDGEGNYNGAIAGVQDITILRHSEKKFRSYMENAPIGIFVADENGTYLELNHKAVEMTGFTEKEILKGKKGIVDFLAPESLSEGEKHFKFLKESGYARGEFNAINKYGDIYCTEVIATSIIDQGRYIGFVTDITERKKTENKYRKLIEDMPSAFAYHKIVLDKKGKPIDYIFEDINDGFTQMTGLDHSIIGKSVLEVLPKTDPFFIETCGEVALNCKTKRFERYVEDQMKWFDIIVYSSEEGYFAVVFNDITEQKETQEKIEYLTFNDSLTGLYNRNYIDSTLSDIDIEENYPLSVIMADLNGLKLINDTYGHQTGDRFLQCVGKIFKAVCRETDIIARWGGDEYIILLPNTTEEVALEFVKRVNDHSCVYCNGCEHNKLREFSISIAMGVSTKDSKLIGMDSIFSEAENRMYRVKLTESRSVRNSIVMAFLETLKAKKFEESHVLRMLPVAERFGQELGLSNSDINNLVLLVNLHDIGKINLREEILTKKGKLTDEEWVEITQHPEIGYRIARATEDFTHVALDILHHHEKWDGSGYPQGVKGKGIPLLARIINIVDSWEVMSGGRPYKEKMSKISIVEEFKRCRGTQFDPELCDIFIDLMEKDIVCRAQLDNKMIL